MEVHLGQGELGFADLDGAGARVLDLNRVAVVDDRQWCRRVVRREGVGQDRELGQVDRGLEASVTAFGESRQVAPVLRSVGADVVPVRSRLGVGVGGFGGRGLGLAAAGAGREEQGG